jgi:hypothetical protein
MSDNTAAGVWLYRDGDWELADDPIPWSTGSDDVRGKYAEAGYTEVPGPPAEPLLVLGLHSEEARPAGQLTLFTRREPPQCLIDIEGAGGATRTVYAARLPDGLDLMARWARSPRPPRSPPSPGISSSPPPTTAAAPSRPAAWSRRSSGALRTPSPELNPRGFVTPTARAGSGTGTNRRGAVLLGGCRLGQGDDEDGGSGGERDPDEGPHPGDDLLADGHPGAWPRPGHGRAARRHRRAPAAIVR